MFGGEKCHINQAFPADIRVVRILFLQGKSTAGNTKSCIRKRTGLQRQEDMAAAGEERARSSYSFIHSVRNACDMASQNLQRLWTTSFRTEVIRSSSGTDRIGNPCVRDAMIRRLGMKTRHRRIIIDSRGNSCGGGGGQNLYEPWPQGPPPPLLLIFANFIGRGSRASRWSAKCTCRMRPARSSFP